MSLTILPFFTGCDGSLQFCGIGKRDSVASMGIEQPRSQGLGSLPRLSFRRKTVAQAGHVALLDKHFPTSVGFSLYFDHATGRKRIRLTRHF